MEFEIPTELIREVQIQLRKEAGLASYDPNDPTLPNLPSLSESIANLDPSPPYLRCKRCNGKLLRDLKSLICVYCGKNLKNEVPPDPIAFKSTSGYRWLLESLGLDGSEIVGSSVKESELNRGQIASKEELLVSDLLDLEIKWPTEEDKNVNSVSNQSPLQRKRSVNLTGVDLDNFFSESKRNFASNAPEEKLGPSTQIRSKDITSFQIHEKLNLFEEVPPAITAVRSSRDEEGDNDSGWKADFQFASSGTTDENSKSFDPFVGSSNDISAHMDTVFGLGSDKNGGNPKDDLVPPASVTNDWNQDDLWNSFNSSVSNQAEQAKGSIEFNDVVPAGKLNSPSASIDWIEDKKWKTSSREVLDSKVSIEDSLDAWNDFSSSSAHHPSKNSVKPSSSEDFIQSDDQNANINLFPSTNNNSREMNLDSFLQPDLFPGASSNPNSSKEVNNTQLEIFLSDSKTDTEVEPKRSAEHAGAGLDIPDATPVSKSADVEMLMSQMHDLSFMLENSLSIPSKPDEFGRHPQD